MYYTLYYAINGFKELHAARQTKLNCYSFTLSLLIFFSPIFCYSKTMKAIILSHSHRCQFQM